MVQLITLTLLKVFFKLLQEFIGVPDRSHWKMPRITCLSIPIITGNIPCSSFFPTCSSLTCHVVCQESTLWICTIPAAHEGFCTACSIDVDSMSLEFLTSGRQSTAAFHTQGGRKVLLHRVPVSITAQPVSEAFQSLLVLDLYFSNLQVLSQTQGTRREQATHISFSVLTLILTPGSQTPFLPVP